MGKSTSKKLWHTSEITLPGRLRVTSGVIPHWHAWPFCLWAEHMLLKPEDPGQGDAENYCQVNLSASDFGVDWGDMAGPPICLPAAFLSLWVSARLSVKQGSTVSTAIWRICLALEVDSRNHRNGRARWFVSSQWWGWGCCPEGPLSSFLRCQRKGERRKAKSSNRLASGQSIWGWVCSSSPFPASGPQKVYSANELSRLCLLSPRLSF